jgi:hypothetical protein
MGMFDEILVPKSYLRGLLKKEDEKLFNKEHLFQTKDLENLMDLYKIHRQRLYKLDRSAKRRGGNEKWNPIQDNIEINFYDYPNDKNGDEYSAEFEFTFKKGRVDQKKLVSLKLERTTREIKSIEAMWDTEQEVLNAYRNTSFKYRFFSFLEARLRKVTNWAREGHTIPIEIRRDAYEKSGRLQFDPECLNIYKDQ